MIECKNIYILSNRRESWVLELRCFVLFSLVEDMHDDVEVVEDVAVGLPYVFFGAFVSQSYENGIATWYCHDVLS